MLTLTRKPGEEIVITIPTGEQLIIKLVRFEDNRIKLGFTGPPEFEIIRAELNQKENNGR